MFEAENNISDHLPLFVICGNKNDLTGRRAVDEDEGRKYASKKKARFHEVSAKENSGILEMFAEIASLCEDK